VKGFVVGNGEVLDEKRRLDDIDVFFRGVIKKA